MLPLFVYNKNNMARTTSYPDRPKFDQYINDEYKRGGQGGKLVRKKWEGNDHRVLGYAAMRSLLYDFLKDYSKTEFYLTEKQIRILAYEFATSQSPINKAFWKFKGSYEGTTTVGAFKQFLKEDSYLAKTVTTKTLQWRNTQAAWIEKNSRKVKRPLVYRDTKFAAIDGWYVGANKDSGGTVTLSRPRDKKVGNSQINYEGIKNNELAKEFTSKFKNEFTRLPSERTGSTTSGGSTGSTTSGGSTGSTTSGGSTGSTTSGGSSGGTSNDAPTAKEIANAKEMYKWNMQKFNEDIKQIEAEYGASLTNFHNGYKTAASDLDDELQNLKDDRRTASVRNKEDYQTEIDKWDEETKRALEDAGIELNTLAEKLARKDKRTIEDLARFKKNANVDIQGKIDKIDTILKRSKADYETQKTIRKEDYENLLSDKALLTQRDLTDNYDSYMRLSEDLNINFTDARNQLKQQAALEGQGIREKYGVQARQQKRQLVGMEDASIKDVIGGLRDRDIRRDMSRQEQAYDQQSARDTRDYDIDTERAGGDFQKRKGRLEDDETLFIERAKEAYARQNAEADLSIERQEEDAETDKGGLDAELKAIQDQLQVNHDRAIADNKAKFNEELSAYWRKDARFREDYDIFYKNLEKRYQRIHDNNERAFQDETVKIERQREEARVEHEEGSRSSRILKTKSQLQSIDEQGEFIYSNAIARGFSPKQAAKQRNDFFVAKNRQAHVDWMNTQSQYETTNPRTIARDIYTPKQFSELTPTRFPENKYAPTTSSQSRYSSRLPPKTNIPKTSSQSGSGTIFRPRELPVWTPRKLRPLTSEKAKYLTLPR